MKLIVGLGNPGTKYEKTRHNLGFMVLERFLKDFEPVQKTVWENNEKFKSDIVRLDWQRRSSRSSSGQARLEKVILVKPKTYMNNSGLAAKLIISYWRLEPSDIWVVYDDIDLPLGSMKIRFGGAAAGHHGVESIIEQLKTDKFWRFRMGTGKNSEFRVQSSESKKRRLIKNVEDYVLGGFKGSEWGKARELIKRGSKALQMAFEEGIEIAQNRFNTK